MSDARAHDANLHLLDVFLGESVQSLHKMEQIILDCENTTSYSAEAVQELSHIAHTFKGSSAVMGFEHMASLTHSIENLFAYLRQMDLPIHLFKPTNELLLRSVDLLKGEIERIGGRDAREAFDPSLSNDICLWLEKLKNGSTGTNPTEYTEQAPRLERMCKIVIFYNRSSGMLNIRAYQMIQMLQRYLRDLRYLPDRLTEDEQAETWIERNGLTVFGITASGDEELLGWIGGMPHIERVDIQEVKLEHEPAERAETESHAQAAELPEAKEAPAEAAADYGMVNVNVKKLNQLMELAGELVLVSDTVVRNPELEHLELPQFRHASRQLLQVAGELQEAIMSVRMLPLAPVFHKMRRLVRDMCGKLGKEAELLLEGEHAEVDRSVLDRIGDPIAQLVRNALEHGIEAPSERAAAGKSMKAAVLLSAKYEGSDVLITIRDDGRGLDYARIRSRALSLGFIGPEKAAHAEQELGELIFRPGFSTNDRTTHGGRAAGLAAVRESLGAVGGSLSVRSEAGQGTEFQLRLPLTVAIIDGMNLRAGDRIWTVPTASIIESFRPAEHDIVTDISGNESIYVRGSFSRIMRVGELFGVPVKRGDPHRGVLVLAEAGGRRICLLADELLGQRQVVVKKLPGYIERTSRIKGVTGCTLLGDGSISLILDVKQLAES